MKKFITLIVILTLSLNYSFGQEKKVNIDTIGYYEIIESYRSGRSYLVEVPILRDSSFLKLLTTGNPHITEALVFPSNQSIDFQAVFETNFYSFISDNYDTKETVIKRVEPMKASGFFTQAGEEHYSLIKQDIKVSYVATYSDGMTNHNIMLEIPKFESFTNSIFKSEAKTIFVTRIGAKMLLDSLSEE